MISTFDTKFASSDSQADCPEPAAERACRLCDEIGHIAAECTGNRLLMDVDIRDLTVETAWKEVEKADEDKDVHDIKEARSYSHLKKKLLTFFQAVLKYAKAFPEVTFEELEQVFRDASMNTYLIAKQQEVSDTHTIINLQGKKDQTYVVSFQFSPKPKRAAFAEGWPSTPEENLTRLAEAGLPMDRMVPKCEYRTSSF